jgi:hypothetical protein
LSTTTNLELRKRNISRISQRERISLRLTARLSRTTTPRLSVGLGLSKSLSLARLSGTTAPRLSSGLGKRLGHGLSSTTNFAARLSGTAAPGLGFRIGFVLLFAGLSGASAPRLGVALAGLAGTTTPCFGFGFSFRSGVALAGLAGAAAPGFGVAGDLVGDYGDLLAMFSYCRGESGGIG